MPGLKDKASNRRMGEKRKPMKIIIGEAMPSTSSFVKETTIKLDPSVKGRGKGEMGVTVGAKKRRRLQNTASGVTTGMGGRR